MTERKNFLGKGNDSFRCSRCGSAVEPLLTGFRNHCPECLWCRHVDRIPGDRASSCGGMMEPVGLEGAEGAGWYLVHRCTRCGEVRRNGTAEKDARQPDRWDLLVALSTTAPPAEPPPEAANLYKETP